MPPGPAASPALGSILSAPRRKPFATFGFASGSDDACIWNYFNRIPRPYQAFDQNYRLSTCFAWLPVTTYSIRWNFAKWGRVNASPSAWRTDTNYPCGTRPLWWQGAHKRRQYRRRKPSWLKSSSRDRASGASTASPRRFRSFPVSAEELNDQGDISLGDALNDLPAFGRPSARPLFAFHRYRGPELARPAGLGVERTLVLVNTAAT